MNYNHFCETPYFHHIRHAMFDNIKKGIKKFEMTMFPNNNMVLHVFTKFLNYVFF